MIQDNSKRYLRILKNTKIHKNNHIYPILSKMAQLCPQIYKKFQKYIKLNKNDKKSPIFIKLTNKMGYQ